MGSENCLTAEQLELLVRGLWMTKRRYRCLSI